jgi:hypothetical protein
VVSRPMKGGHFGVLRFLTTFDQANAEERHRIRGMNREISSAGLALGFLTYKTPPWAVELLAPRLDPGFADLVRQVRRLLDPQGIMAPHCWRLP